MQPTGMKETMRVPRLEVFVSTVVGPALGSSPGRLHRREARRIGFGLFFGSVCFNAALGIYALVAGEFGETEGKILGTSLSVTGALVLALVCAPAWERRLLGLVPPAAALVGATGFALVAVSMWAGGESDTLGKTIGTLLVVGGAGALASLLVLATLAPPHAIVFRLVLGLETVAAGMMVTGLWLDLEREEYWRAFGVVMIVLAALVVSIPVLHRIGRAALAVAGAEPVEPRYCPYCAAEVVAAEERPATCARCRRSFTVRGLM